MTKQHQTILITGANKGIGLGLTKKLLASNNKIIATCRNSVEAVELSQLRDCNPEQLEILKLDVTNINDIDHIVEHLNDKPIDILINNAAIFGEIHNYPEDIDAQAYLDVINTNATFPMLLSLKLMKNILLSEKKIIISISSIFGSLGYLAYIKEFQSAGHRFSNGDVADPFYKKIFHDAAAIMPYAYSKAAFNAMLSVLSVWFYKHNLKTLFIHPGNVLTQMTEHLPDRQYRISIEESTSKIINIINNAHTYRTASFIDYTGIIIDDLLNAKPEECCVN